MTCEESRLLIAEELFGARPANEDLEAHLASCEACRAEAEPVRATWRRMASLPDPEPRPGMSTRFYAALDAYQQAHAEKRSGFWSWWPSKPVWQFAVSMGCLAIGLLTGVLIAGGRAGAPASSGEIAQLRKEMSGMRQLVTLSLLQQQSASERLRGVTYSYRAEPNDVEVLGALLQTVRTDDNVDVRLAAVDALRNFGNSPVARRGLRKALLKQESPLVQISIIDALTEMRDGEAIPAMQSLSQSPDLDANVQKRIRDAMAVIR
jgi:hypothetical protein